mmetsp:Transcript_125169/g.348291  ORF Transcript_125169/g.348291 Transcript_125169/m.348291 type:complete len:207 (-) Transcript_125169:12-632(-)
MLPGKLQLRLPHQWGSMRVLGRLGPAAQVVHHVRHWLLGILVHPGEPRTKAAAIGPMGLQDFGQHVSHVPRRSGVPMLSKLLAEGFGIVILLDVLVQASTRLESLLEGHAQQPIDGKGHPIRAEGDDLLQHAAHLIRRVGAPMLAEFLRKLLRILVILDVPPQAWTSAQRFRERQLEQVIHREPVLVPRPSHRLPAHARGGHEAET